jgi:hypothetical protein
LIEQHSSREKYGGCESSGKQPKYCRFSMHTNIDSSVTTRDLMTRDSSAKQK